MNKIFVVAVLGLLLVSCVYAFVYNCVDKETNNNYDNEMKYGLENGKVYTDGMGIRFESELKDCGKSQVIIK